jgi:starch-binding outer membrane protein, SusD/RagB family
MRKYNFISYKNICVGCLQLMIAVLFIGCNSLVELDPPKTEVLASDVFKTDKNANAAVIGMYSSMITDASMLNIGYGCGLSADENDGTNAIYPFTNFGTNSLTSSDYGAQGYWTSFYQTIYQANNIIENATASIGMSDSIKAKVIGQAKFVRGLSFFYLVNMFGPVPLVVSSDVKINRALSRAPIADIYAQIISDLQDAEIKLPVDYTTYDNKRDKPIQKTASALLAKVYLYTANYDNAEKKATEVINTTDLYELLPTSKIGNVFLKDSKESIYGLNTESSSGQRLTTEQYYYEYGSLYGSSSGSMYVMLPSLANAFELGDARKTAWTGSFDYNGTTYYYDAKYKDYDGMSSPLEYSVVLRLSELYLIRAEARVMQTDIPNGLSDLNTIRTRAGLANIQPASKSDVLDAIMQERRVELFLEYGNRWFDLKRTGRADAVLSALKPAIWKSTAVLYPIPLAEIKRASQLTQNAGY